MREVAVGGEDEQPAAVGVEPADGNEARDGFDEVHDGAALIRITARRDHTGRLVEDDGDGNCAGGDAVSVDAHAIDRRVDDRAEAAHLAVDGHPTGGDQLVGAAP